MLPSRWCFIENNRDVGNSHVIMEVFRKLSHDLSESSNKRKKVTVTVNVGTQFDQEQK